MCDFRTENYSESCQWADSSKRADGNHGPIWRWKVVAAEHSYRIQVSHCNYHNFTPIVLILSNKTLKKDYIYKSCKVIVVIRNAFAEVLGPLICLVIIASLCVIEELGLLTSRPACAHALN
jgi:hypothetical protein